MSHSSNRSSRTAPLASASPPNTTNSEPWGFERKSPVPSCADMPIGKLGSASRACYDFSISEQVSESMKKRISISACRRAILIAEWGYEPGIPLEIGGEERMITDIEIRGGRWYSGDRRLTRGQQEKLTQRALAIIEDDQQPRLAPKISIRDCQKAIGIAGAHQDLAPGKGEADHRSHNRWGRELPMVRRRPSLWEL